ncbi:MAG: hypothetical protein L6V91_00980 [Bacilli bacterium]|nr:MAG: hypothetical protein L6V91_00980 [Bacilli bacterium]
MKLLLIHLMVKIVFVVGNDDTVSMNFLLFTPSIFEYIEEGFDDFFIENKDNLLTSEYLIPDVVSNLINKGKSFNESY